MNSDLNELEIKLKAYDKNLNKIRQERNKVNTQYITSLMKECGKNIGRCFAEYCHGTLTGYWRITDIDRPKVSMEETTFNEYQYCSICFTYPYDYSVTPFTEDSLFSAAWGKGNDCVARLNGITYKEISKEEWTEKFKEVNDAWIENLTKID